MVVNRNPAATPLKIHFIGYNWLVLAETVKIRHCVLSEACSMGCSELFRQGLEHVSFTTPHQLCSMTLRYYSEMNPYKLLNRSHV